MGLRDVWVLGSVLWLSSAATCAHTQSNYDYSKEPDPRKQEYIIGASDLLKITVWHNTDVSADVIVRPDGTVSLPLAGDLKAAGKTPGQLRDELTQKLTPLFKEPPIITVAVAAVNSYRFTVSGNVEHPGAFSSNHYVTVTEAIALAGGPNKYASPEDGVLIRTDPQTGVRRIPIDYPAILSGARTDQNLPLMPGDTLYIP